MILVVVCVAEYYAAEVILYIYCWYSGNGNLKIYTSAIKFCFIVYYNAKTVS